MSIVSLAEQKTFMGITGTQDDQVISNFILQAEAQVERDTGRVFSYSSNVSRTYSSDGQASVTIRDIPAVGSNARAVTLGGVQMVNGTTYWALPDRRNPEVSTTLQLRPYDRTRGDWYKAYPNWFDANLDNPRYAWAIGQPNDLVITGAEGHPTPVPADVSGMIKLKAQLLYWQMKAGASGTVATPTGDLIDLAARDPVGYPEFVRDWKIRTAVMDV
jgi:hypothetical protein